MSYTKRYRTPMGIACLVVLWVVMLWLGCSVPSESPTAESSTVESPATERSGSHSFIYGPIYDGKVPLDVIIVYSDVVARVRFISVKQVVEPHDISLATATARRIVYVHALEYTFQVLEYLKGSGPTEIKVLAGDGTGVYLTVAEAEAAGSDILALRDTRWDDREAIVMVAKTRALPKTLTDADRYSIGYGKLSRGDETYTVASRWGPKWLPDAAAPATDSDGVSRAVEGEQSFLVEAPTAPASGQTRSAGARTVTTSGLSAIISRLQAEIDAGGGVPGYEECIQKKYYLQFRVDNDPTPISRQQFSQRIDSGIPAGTVVYDADKKGDRVELHGPTEPEHYQALVLKSGQDADLFDHQWPFLAVTVRPLPAGDYRFYSWGQPLLYSLCDAWPEQYKTSNEVLVRVNAPEGTLHEAFFDPVTMGAGVGADSSSGVLKPTAFTVDGTSTTITGLKWERGSVVLSLSPYSSLSGHKLDFIGLDGSVSLSLAVSSATEDTTAGTLSWSVTDQPWHNGDLLMLRIATLTVTPNPTPVPTAEPTPIPTAGITVTLSPRPLISTDYINLSIRWVDPASCDSRYFVGIYNSSGTTIYRFYGYHPAPDTTSLERELGLLWDRIADLDWLVRVSCVPASGDESLVGEAELRSGLPETP